MASESENSIREELLLVLSTEGAAPFVPPILAAAARKNLRVAIFLTGKGAALACASKLGLQFSTLENAVVCAESWQQYANLDSNAEPKCMVELGSQTDHSRLVGDASRVLSL